MRFAKRVLMVAGAVALAGILGVVIAPKAAHGLVAALVQVANTSTNPVSIYDSGGTRFQADLCDASGAVSVAAGYCGSNNSSSFVVPTVTSAGATVKRLVIDNVGGFCASYNNQTVLIKSVVLIGQFVPDSVPNGDSSETHYIPIVGPAYSYVNTGSGPPLGGVPETDYSFGQATHMAFNPGDTVSLRYKYFFPGGPVDAVCAATVEGTLATE
jgi:hypothetical protein